MRTNHVCFGRALAIAMIAFGLCASKVLAEPEVFWVSTPAKPGETVLLQGADFGSEPVVEVAQLAEADDGRALTWSRAELLQKSDCSLKFVLPASWKLGIYACRIKTGDGASKSQWINAPDAWWMQGDRGDACSPGGWLRVLGKSLHFAGESTARLKREGAAPLVLTAKKAECYSLRFDLPADLAAGRYEIEVHNGCGGQQGWREAGAVRVDASQWPTDVFNVLDFYGKDALEASRKTLIKYNDVPDRSEGIKAALKKAKENGGGVVYFPAGRYGIEGELSVPPRTVLKGEGCGLVVLWWGKGRFNLDGGGQQGLGRETDESKLPGMLLYGPQFALEDMSLYLPLDYRVGISCDQDFQMRRVRVRIDHYWMLDGSKRAEGTVARLGKNFEVSDCDILAKGAGLIPGQNGLIARNRIMAGKTNCPLGGSAQVIVEDNHLISMYPTAYQNIAGVGRNLYYARNRNEALNVHQADFSFTFDAGPSAYHGAMEVSGTQITLASDPTYPDWAKENSDIWKKSIVCILDGRGAGQWRYVTANKGRAWQVDRPFDCLPDATSVVTIVPLNGRSLVVGNQFEDANWVNAGYGTSIEVLYSGNRMVRCAQLLNYGIADSEYQPSWYIQYLDNEILEGNTSVDITGAVKREVSYTGPITRCVVQRRTTIAKDNNGAIHVGGRVSDVIVEDCVLNHPTSVIRVDGEAEGVLLRNNVFAAGTSPRYEGNAVGTAAILPPPGGKPP